MVMRRGRTLPIKWVKAVSVISAFLMLVFSAPFVVHGEEGHRSGGESVLLSSAGESINAESNQESGLHGDIATYFFGPQWEPYQTYHHHCDSCTKRDVPVNCKEGCPCPCRYCTAYQASFRACRCEGCEDPQCACECEPGTTCRCEGCAGYQPPECECGCGSLQSECDAEGGCGNLECACPGCQPPPPVCECGCGSLQSECDAEGGCGNPECACPGCQPPPPVCECNCGSLQSECDAEGGCRNPECACPGCQLPPPVCECGCGSLQSECDAKGGCGNPECACPGCQPPPPICECGCGSLQSECDAEGGCGNPKCACENCRLEPEEGENNPETGGQEPTPPDPPRGGSGQGSGDSGRGSGPDRDPARPPQRPSTPEPEVTEGPAQPEAPIVTVTAVQSVMSTAEEAPASVVDTLANPSNQSLPMEDLENIYYHSVSVGAMTPLSISGGGDEIVLSASSGASPRAEAGAQEAGDGSIVVVSPTYDVTRKANTRTGLPSILLIGGEVAAFGAAIAAVRWFSWRNALRKMAREKWQ